jgi:hypothetical protein
LQLLICANDLCSVAKGSRSRLNALTIAPRQC